MATGRCLTRPRRAKRCSGKSRRSRTTQPVSTTESKISCVRFPVPRMGCVRTKTIRPTSCLEPNSRTKSKIWRSPGSGTSAWSPASETRPPASGNTSLPAPSWTTTFTLSTETPRRPEHRHFSRKNSHSTIKYSVTCFKCSRSIFKPQMTTKF